MEIKHRLFCSRFPRNVILMAMLLLISLSFAWKSALAEDWLLCGYTEKNHFPENGVTGKWLGEDEQYIYLPDGLSVTVDEPTLSQTEGSARIKLPGQTAYNVAVDLAVLMRADEYPMVSDRPSFVTPKEVYLYQTPEMEADKLLHIVRPGSRLDVIASMKRLYYVCTEHGDYGFIEKEILSFPKTAAHRYYDQYLSYTEEIFEKPSDSAIPALEQSEAIQMARNYILSAYPAETVEHVNSLSCDARFNAAHEYGAWGMTWLVVFYGDCRTWNEPNHFLYVPDHEEMMVYDASSLLNDTFDLRSDLDAGQREMAETLWQGNIAPYHVHYVVTVVQNSLKCYLLALT